MQRFILNNNSQANGDHEIHNTTKGCDYMPNTKNQIDLGLHESCVGAVSEAKRRWSDKRINGCYYCCNGCHTT